jgi:CheY-like chemotaxis protein
MADEASLILLVDDDFDFLEMNRHVLESKGYRVLCASDPDEALAKMGSDTPAVVITDLMMKTLDSGFLFSRRLKEDRRFKDIPVIIVTAVGSRCGFDFRPRTQEELQAMCADAYFAKPVTPEKLLEKVEELLMRRGREGAT